MKVIVRLGEPFWRVAGARETTVTLLSGQTVAHAVKVLTKRYPPFVTTFHNAEIRPMLIMNEAEACPETPLTEGATLHIVLPLSGG